LRLGCGGSSGTTTRHHVGESGLSRQREALTSSALTQQGRQDSNLQPPVLEFSAKRPGSLALMRVGGRGGGVRATVRAGPVQVLFGPGHGVGLVAGHQVAISVERDRDRRIPHVRRQRLDVHAGVDRHRRERVPRVGSGDQIRIEAAAKNAPIEQLCLSAQCGFSSTVEGNALMEDEQWAKLRLIVEVADEVWA